MVVQVQQFTQFVGKTFGVFQVLHAQGTACNFVFVGRTNAATGGADFFGTALFTRRFTGHVKRCMKRQNQGASFADAQARTHFDAGFFQAFNFFKQFAR